MPGIPERARGDDVQWQHKHGGGRSAAPGKATKPPVAYRLSDPLIEDQEVPRNEIISCNTTSVGHSILEKGCKGTAR